MCVCQLAVQDSDSPPENFPSAYSDYWFKQDWPCSQLPGACLQLFGFPVWIINMKQDWCLPLGSVFLQGTCSQPVVSTVLSPEPKTGAWNMVSTQEMVNE